MIAVAVDVQRRGDNVQIQLTDRNGRSTLVSLTDPDALTLADLLTIAAERRETGRA